MSVSLLDGNSVPSDLPAKYQKLASEYAKIRAQFGVLKKAVVDEQNQTTELKEILRTKDQNLRKAEQELHSLNFRNQQLTKRVTILQDELDSVQGTSKSKSKSHSKDKRDSVIVEELQNKIAENAHLVTRLQEQTEEYESERFKLNQQIQLQEHRLKEYESGLSGKETAKVAKYEAETKQLQSRLTAKDDEIKKLQNEIKQLKIDLLGRNAALESSELQEKYSNLIQSLSLNELLTLFSQFFQQLEFRYRKHMQEQDFGKLEKINQRNRLMLKDFADSYLLCNNVDIEQNFLIDSEELSKNVQAYASILEELSECLNCSNDKNVITAFKQIICNMQKHWVEFDSALLSVHHPNLSSPSKSTEDVVNSFPEVFRSLRGTCDYYLSIFNEKFKSHSLHGESESEILKILSNLSQQSSSIYRKLTENSSVLKHVLDIHIFRAKQKAAASETKKCCESWKQEIEILKAAHSKKIKDLEEQISCLSEATTPRSTNSGQVVQSPSEDNLEESNEFAITTNVESPGVRNEAEYLKFFNARANKLVADRQYAESRVTVLKDECEALQKRLGHSLENRLLLEDSLKQAQNTIGRLQEELQTTTVNYEVQLQSMSEHMANLNEKLASQQEEIEILRHELTEKFQGMKRGK